MWFLCCPRKFLSLSLSKKILSGYLTLVKWGHEKNECTRIKHWKFFKPPTLFVYSHKGKVFLLSPKVSTLLIRWTGFSLLSQFSPYSSEIWDPVLKKGDTI